MANIGVRFKIFHKIQHRHPDIVRWFDDNCETERDYEVATTLVKFILDRFPETADSLNGELVEWEDAWG